jgi:cysteine desulfuration protein SufE
MTPLQQIKDDFAFLDDWEDRYRYVIELGRTLDPLTDDERVDQNKVHGCASQVWLVSRRDGSESDPVLHFRGDSDAHIVKGLVAIALSAFSGRKASEIEAFDASNLFDELGLVEHLSQQRANGLRSMVARIKGEAERAAA